LILQARQAYNAVGDSFFSAAELYNKIFEAEQTLAIETKCIQDTATTSTVASQHEYVKPDNSLSIRRVTYNGQNLIPINFTEDDAVTGFSAATTQTGTPTYYYEWETSLFLRPIPNEVQTLKIWYYALPGEVTAVSTLEVPSQYHMRIVDFLLDHMFGKDGKSDMAAYHRSLWNESVNLIISWEARKRRGNQTAAVINLDAFSELSTIV
jgi:hypothetical protein